MRRGERWPGPAWCWSRSRGDRGRHRDLRFAGAPVGPDFPANGRLSANDATDESGARRAWRCPADEGGLALDVTRDDSPARATAGGAWTPPARPPAAARGAPPTRLPGAARPLRRRGRRQRQAWWAGRLAGRRADPPVRPRPRPPGTHPTGGPAPEAPAAAGYGPTDPPAAPVPGQPQHPHPQQPRPSWAPGYRPPAVPPPPADGGGRPPKRVETVPGTPFGVVHLDVPPVDLRAGHRAALVAGIASILVLLVICFGGGVQDGGWGLGRRGVRRARGVVAGGGGRSSPACSVDGRSAARPRPRGPVHRAGLAMAGISCGAAGAVISLPGPGPGPAARLTGCTGSPLVTSPRQCHGWRVVPWEAGTLGS